MRTVRGALQLLIIVLWAFLAWRNHDLPAGQLALLSVFFGGLLLLASVLGTRYSRADYEWPPSFTQTTAIVVSLLGLGLPILTGNARLLLVLPVWWGLIMAYLSHPAGSDLQQARQCLLSLKQQPLGVMVTCKRLTILLAFWPVFIPKALYCWGLLLLCCAWLAIDIF